MTAHRPRRLVRDLHAGAQLDLFFVSAVASVLLIRFYLRITGYPQVGGATLHVAHMLWGGLLMMAGLLLVLAFLGRASRQWAALLGGIGFGTFIDEVGKFVTRDHDYFYRPAIALIYVVFVGMYLAVRAIRSRQGYADEEYVVNALQELEESAIGDLQLDERERATRYLAAVREPTTLTTGLTRLLGSLELVPARAPSRAARARRWILHRYQRLARRPEFWRGLVIFFAAQIVVKLLHVALLVFSPGSGESAMARLALMSREVDGYTLAEWLQLGSSLVSAAFVIAGIVALRTSHHRALRAFQRSILVSIFVTQVFMFYRAQWEALVVLGFNLVVLLGLQYMRAHEPERA